MNDLVWKLCTQCSDVKSAHDFYKDHRASDGLDSECKSCLLFRQKTYRINNKEKMAIRDAKYKQKKGKAYATLNASNWAKKHRARISEYQKAWRKNNPLAIRAHRLVARLIKSGQLIRPESCQKCGDSSVKIEGSHDDYNKPEVVEWLCPRCHRIKDRNPMMKFVLDAL